MKTLSLSLSLVVWSLWLTLVGSSNVELHYNNLRQKSSHNSYLREEGLADQLQYHHIRSLELDLHIGIEPGDWSVYHISIVDTATTCSRLSSCLDVLYGWSNANPNHEVVTVWMDLQSNDVNPENKWSLDAMGGLINTHLTREKVFKPSDLLELNGHSANSLDSNIQKALQGNGKWPTTKELRNKFIFVLQSKDNNKVAEYWRTHHFPFVFCDKQTATTLLTVDHCVFFNEKCNEQPKNKVCESVYENKFICRCYNSDDVTNKIEWEEAAENKVSHIATDRVNYHEDTDIKSHNSYGWPFEAIDGTDVSENHLNNENEIIGISVWSGDIWDDKDSFAFAYKQSSCSTWRVMLNNAQSHVDGWAKAAVMARYSLNPNSRYFAVVRADKPSNTMRVQYRKEDGKDTKSEDVPGQCSPHIDGGTLTHVEMSACFVAATGITHVSASVSVNNKWPGCKFFTESIVGELKYQGLAASSHNDVGNGGYRVMHLFTQVKEDQNIRKLSDFSLVNIGSNVDSELFNAMPVSVWSDYVNSWDGSHSTWAPVNQVFCGVSSFYDSTTRDRKFRFKYCNVGAEETGITSYRGPSSWDATFNHDCPSDTAIRYWESQHDNGKEDRTFKMGCQGVINAKFSTSCAWVGYVNDWHMHFDYECPKGKALAGVASTHDNGKEDRLFKFKCCGWIVEEPSEQLPVYKSVSMSGWSGYVNNWDAAHSTWAPGNQAFCGVSSYHDNKKEDRRFRFKYCTVSGAQTTGSVIYRGPSTWDAAFNHDCPANSVLRYWWSQHSDKNEDRRFQIGCQGFANADFTSDCVGSGYINSWDAQFHFECQGGKVLAGMGSYHDNKREDRRFKFKCCKWKEIDSPQSSSLFVWYAVALLLVVLFVVALAIIRACSSVKTNTSLISGIKTETMSKCGTMA